MTARRDRETAPDPRRATIELRAAGRPVRGAVAVFVAGRDVERWLAAATALGGDGRGPRIYVLPPCTSDEAASGALLVPDGVLSWANPQGERVLAGPTLGRTNPQEPPASALGVPYGRMGERLYLPVDAELEPDLGEAEVALLWPAHAVVFHPSLGPVEFEERDVLTLETLVAPPVRRARAWNRAWPGRERAPGLRSVEPIEPPTVETIRAEARGDIGSKRPADPEPRPQGGNPACQTPAKRSHPSAPENPGWIERQVAKGIKWCTDQAPGGAPQRTWLDDLSDWAQRRLEPSHDDLESRRERELRRLVKMMEEDPDEGLRHALPLAGLGGHRGTAPPSSTLGVREPDFSLGRLFGGRPADAWWTPAEIRKRLSDAYRNEAERLAALGRFRRAAYIHAELLGDLETAAAVLKAGRCFREAAVLYRDHLARPQAAARCLEEGGLLLEAIAIWEAEARFLEAAELYEKLARLPDAAEAYRKAVTQRQASGDLIGAAELLEVKLGAAEEALMVYRSGWPKGRQAARCLSEWFALLGRLGRHDDARAGVAALPEEPLSSARRTVLAETLSAVARSYPDTALRHRASDMTRVIAARQLPIAEPGESLSLVQAVSRLAPEDRLLERDVVRYMTRRPGKRTADVATATAKSPALLDEFRLAGDDGTLWTSVARTDLRLIAAGRSADGGLVVTSATWSHKLESVGWSGWDSRGEGVILAAPRVPFHPLIVWLTGESAMRLPPRRLESGGRAGSPDWMPSDTRGVCYQEAGLIWVLRTRDQEGPNLVSYTPDGKVVGTYELAEAVRAGLVLHGGASVEMVALPRQLFLATGGLLHHMTAGGNVRTLEMPGWVRGMALPAAFTRLRIAVVFDQGGVVLWPARAGEALSQAVFGERMIRPKAALTGEGYLVVLSRAEGRVYDARSTQLKHLASFDGPGTEPIAVTAGPRLDEYAVVLADGWIRRYRIPGRWRQ